MSEDNAQQSVNAAANTMQQNIARQSGQASTPEDALLINKIGRFLKMNLTNLSGDWGNLGQSRGWASLQGAAIFNLFGTRGGGWIAKLLERLQGPESAHGDASAGLSANPINTQTGAGEGASGGESGIAPMPTSGGGFNSQGLPPLPDFNFTSSGSSATKIEAPQSSGGHVAAAAPRGGNKSGSKDGGGGGGGRGAD